MTAIRSSALAFAAVSLAALGAFGAVALADDEAAAGREPERVISVAFTAIQAMPQQSPELAAALARVAKADREAVRNPAERPVRTVTVEERIGSAVSALIRLPLTEMAAR